MDLDRLDKLAHAHLWDQLGNTWRPESSWHSILMPHCNYDQQLFADVCNYARKLRDKSGSGGDVKFRTSAPKLDLDRLDKLAHAHLWDQLGNTWRPKSSWHSILMPHCNYDQQLFADVCNYTRMLHDRSGSGGDVKFRTSVPELNLGRLDELAHAHLWDQLGNTWRPESSWHSILMPHCNYDQQLFADVCNYARKLRDKSGSGGDVKFRTSAPKLDLDRLDKLAHAHLWDQLGNTWRPESSWHSILMPHCNYDQQLFADVCNYTRMLHDRSGSGGDVKFRTSVPELNLGRLDELAHAHLWDQLGNTWRPESSWHSILMPHCNYDQQLFADVCNYARKLRDKPTPDLNATIQKPTSRLDVRRLDELAQTHLWDRTRDTWLPEEHWASLLMESCGFDKRLVAEVCSYARTVRDTSASELNVPFKAPSPCTNEPQAPSAIGRYEIVGEIGRGGMGVVYEVSHRGQDNVYRKALKLVNNQLNTATFTKKFRAERQLLNRLEHENIVKILDDDSTDDGRPYFVMELVDGAKHIDKYCSSAHLRLKERLELFDIICQAIHHAHTKDVLHLDIKPSNVLVSKEGKVKIVDFGLAALYSTEAPIYVTGTLGVIGTPGYMSPEQQRGEQVSSATDVYLLALLLQELLPPDIRRDLGPPDSSRNRDIDSALFTALQSTPHYRYPSPQAFAKRLQSIVGQPADQLSTPVTTAHSPILHTQGVAQSARNDFAAEGPFARRFRLAAAEVRTWALTHTRLATLLVVALVCCCLYLTVFLKDSKRVPPTNKALIAHTTIAIPQTRTYIARLFSQLLPPPVQQRNTVDPASAEASARLLATSGDRKVKFWLALLYVYGANALLHAERGRDERYRDERSSEDPDEIYDWGIAMGLNVDPSSPTESFAELKHYFSETKSNEGLLWLRELADARCSPASLFLAETLWYSKTDQEEAFNRALSAAKTRDRRAYSLLGTFYSTGMPGFLIINQKKAIEYWNQAASAGDYRAQMNLARLYWNGYGPGESRIPAYQWATIAAGNHRPRWLGSLVGNEVYVRLTTTATAVRNHIGRAQTIPGPGSEAWKTTSIDDYILRPEAVQTAQRSANDWLLIHEKRYQVFPDNPWEELTCPTNAGP